MITDSTAARSVPDPRPTSSLALPIASLVFTAIVVVGKPELATPGNVLCWALWPLATAALAAATRRPVLRWTVWSCAFGVLSMIAMVFKPDPDLDARMPYHRFLTIIVIMGVVACLFSIAERL